MRNGDEYFNTFACFSICSSLAFSHFHVSGLQLIYIVMSEKPPSKIYLEIKQIADALDDADEARAQDKIM